MKAFFVAFALLTAWLLLHPDSFAAAQQPPQQLQQASASQVALSAKQIEGFIAAQKDITAITKKILRLRRPSLTPRSALSSTAQPRSTASKALPSTTMLPEPSHW